MMMGVKFILFVASMLGSCIFIRRISKIRLEFLPILYCAFVSNAMFAAGLLNVMPEMTMLLWASGIAALVYEVLKRGNLKNREVILLSVFGGILLYFSWLLRGSHFTHYDNFSHWAVVIKDMLLSNRMPNFEDPLIMFQAYPLGSSLFIYYVCKILRTSDACFLWAQMLMLVSCIFTGAAFIKKKNAYMVLPLFFYGVYVLVANISIYDLLVDTLLPLVGVAALAMILEYKNKSDSALFCAGLMFPFLVNIKNSGIFFYIICLIALFSCLWKQRKEYWKKFVGFGIVPVAAIMFLWKKHIALVFASGATSKHAMSVENYKHIFADKGKEDILAVFNKWQKTFFTWNNQNIRMLIFLMFLILLVWTIYGLNHQGKEYRKRALGMIGLALGIICAYQLGILGMYLFSMPTGEALTLAGYGRYQLTGNQFVFGMLLLLIMKDLEVFRPGKNICSSLAKIALVCGCALPMWNISPRLEQLYKKPVFEGTGRYRVQKIIRENDLNENGKYMIYVNGDPGYIYYMLRYELWNSQVAYSYTLDKTEKTVEWLKNYDTLILWDEPEDGYAKYIAMAGGPKVLVVEH